MKGFCGGKNMALPQKKGGDGMPEKESAEARRTALAEELWLQYFNQTLYEKGIITQAQRDWMKIRIGSRKPSADPGR